MGPGSERLPPQQPSPAPTKGAPCRGAIARPAVATVLLAAFLLSPHDVAASAARRPGNQPRLSATPASQSAREAGGTAGERKRKGRDRREPRAVTDTPEVGGACARTCCLAWLGCPVRCPGLHHRPSKNGRIKGYI